MTRPFLIATGVLLLTATHAAAQVELSPSEAVKLLHADGNESNITSMVWNGERVIFVDLPVEHDAMAERHAYIVRKVDSKVHALKVMVATEEGGKPEVAAVGLANADRDTERTKPIDSRLWLPSERS